MQDERNSKSSFVGPDDGVIGGREGSRPERALVRKHFYRDLAKDLEAFFYGRKKDVMEPVRPSPPTMVKASA